MVPSQPQVVVRVRMEVSRLGRAVPSSPTRLAHRPCELIGDASWHDGTCEQMMLAVCVES